MTRDAARRLRLAKRAAVAVLKAGGTSEAAAAAAQAHGTPCADSDASDASEEDEASEDAEDETVLAAVDGLAIGDVASAGSPAAATQAAATQAAAASQDGQVRRSSAGHPRTEHSGDGGPRIEGA